MSAASKQGPTFASVAGALTKMGCALMGSGQRSKAVALVENILAQRPDDPAVASAARIILSHNVPQWHAQMLADAERNRAFERAIARAVREGDTVLDIGAGSGLLSLMAARAGASAVYACEADAALAATAGEIAARNGYADKIRVVSKRSTELDRDADLGGGADVVVSEIFSDDLICEGALPTFEHAAAALARPGARIIPASASIRLALAFRDEGPAKIGEVHGFDLSPFNRHIVPETKMGVGSPRLHLRSEAATLFRFDLEAGGPFPNQRADVPLIAAGGPANGVVRWIRLQLDPLEAYENEPGAGSKSHWSALFWPLPGEPLEPGQSIIVHAAHDRERVHLWFS